MNAYQINITLFFPVSSHTCRSLKWRTDPHTAPDSNAATIMIMMKSIIHSPLSLPCSCMISKKLKPQVQQSAAKIQYHDDQKEVQHRTIRMSHQFLRPLPSVDSCPAAFLTSTAAGTAETTMKTGCKTIFTVTLHNDPCTVYENQGQDQHICHFLFLLFVHACSTLRRA